MLSSSLTFASVLPNKINDEMQTLDKRAAATNTVYIKSKTDYCLVVPKVSPAFSIERLNFYKLMETE